MKTFYESIINKIYTDTNDIIKRLGYISEYADLKEEAKEEILDLADALTSDIFYFDEKVNNLRKLIEEGEKDE